MVFIGGVQMLHLMFTKRLVCTSAYRSFNLIKSFKPEISGVLSNAMRNNHLPKEYETMMQKVMHRIGPTVIGRKRLYSIHLSRRERKLSESARLSTPEGRLVMFRRLIAGRRSLWGHDW